MKKIILIIKREYLIRVKKKAFLITTLLFPLAYMGLIYGTSHLGSNSKIKVAVFDNSGYFSDSLLKSSNIADNSITLVSSTDTSIRSNYRKAGFDGYINLPPMDWKKGNSNIRFVTDQTYGLGTESMLTTKFNAIWKEKVNEKLGIDSSVKNILANSNLQVKELNQKNLNADYKVASTIGYVCGFLIYLILLVYGTQVMMGVMEEKTNRIAEVIVSSVRPFQLMLGKIIGISLVALTQFLIWVACIFIVYNVSKSMSSANDMANGIVQNIQSSLTSVNLPLVLGCFAFYFMGGFFFYASLYAAIGSAINEDVREAQSLSLPITMLIIFSIAMMSEAIKHPTGNVAFWGSMIPISSPIVMMARLPFGVPGTVPVWQLLLSMASLIGGFLFTTWIAAKIYRTGILMYGKKPTWREMIKWVIRK